MNESKKVNIELYKDLISSFLKEVRDDSILEIILDILIVEKKEQGL